MIRILGYEKDFKDAMSRAKEYNSDNVSVDERIVGNETYFIIIEKI